MGVKEQVAYSGEPRSHQQSLHRAPASCFRTFSAADSAASHRRSPPHKLQNRLAAQGSGISHVRRRARGKQMKSFRAMLRFSLLSLNPSSSTRLTRPFRLGLGVGECGLWRAPETAGTAHGGPAVV